MEIKQMNIYEKMLKATTEINNVAKDLNVAISKTASYKAVSEVEVLKAVKPIEEKYGIYSYPVSRKQIKEDVFTSISEYNGNKTEKNTLFMRIETVYRFVNVDKPEEYIDITTYGDGVDTQDKAPGKAMTYADKYALLKAYKIQTGEDPDVNASGDLKKKNRPTVAQLKEAQEAGVNLQRLADHIGKCKIDEISVQDLQEAIKMKREAAEKAKQAEAKNV